MVDEVQYSSENLPSVCVARSANSLINFSELMAYSPEAGSGGVHVFYITFSFVWRYSSSSQAYRVCAIYQ